MKGRGLRSPLPGVSGLSGRDGHVYEQPMYKVKGGLNVSKNRDAQSVTHLRGIFMMSLEGMRAFWSVTRRGGRRE